ncbi:MULTISPECIES: DUF2178 domain-containing protein [Haloferax]|uniref:DUF2178 domain-containing protein n=1 Tax=Haloferax lucentense (strain DSM 14919 / JCM 9276 / NCIMB 13854 / Aa 2.2) TaxID=1230452 RepID=M0GCT0_HALL2|nr:MULTISPECIES: DUF2178 domain-containing protein [Haloferax]ELK49270.1 hypothetical protein D320_19184 [Haloferax sp. BAB-2207]ELZ70076.1 hypothetical protein C456_18311 [Haloferax lucentense DSM 14919]RDZ36537.1 DUF2178 domain-containing protein [Haloferax sp. Atlit-24N]RLM37335.1 DUF2178 domain-containing protein [Haloferax sp. Atlit-109R]RLM45275.1 DUF2178 domain-containing protein [Haloferax sp. Atlit-105R]
MSQVQRSPTPRLSRQRRYRRLLFGSIGAGVLASLVLRFLDYPVLGEAVYWLGIVAALAVWRGTDVALFDERDRSLERRASQLTMTVAAVVLVLGASAARLGATLELFEVSPFLSGALYGYVGLFGLFALCYLWVRART